MKCTMVFILVSVFLLPMKLFSADTLRLAVVDVQEIIDSIEEGKQTKTDLEKEQKQKMNIVEEKKKEIMKMQQDMEKQRLILSQEALMEKQKQLDGKMREAQTAYMSATEDFSKKYAETLQQLYNKIQSVVAKIAKESDYSMVLEKGDGRGVIFSKNTFDVTKKVVDTYNQVYPLAKGAPKK